MSKLMIFATVSVGVFAFVVVYLASPIYATSTTGNNSGTIQISLKQNTLINTKVTTRSIQNNQKIIKLLQNHISSLSSKGKDTRKLSVDLNSFKAMVKSFAYEYSSLISVVKDSKLVESKLVLSQVKQKAQNIYEYLNTVIRNDLEKVI